MKQIENACRIVFKFGTNVLSNENHEISLSRIYSFVECCAKLRKQGKEIIIVSSGAIGLGADKAGIDASSDMILKQICAAVGQSRLMSIYEHGFEQYDIVCAQILLTAEDFSDRAKYLSLSNVLDEMLRLGIIPIINQNDTVSTEELEYSGDVLDISFSDNDKLSALVASRSGADLLVILSDIDSLYTSNPKENQNALRIPVVTEITPEIESYAGGASKGGRGGMITKLEAARVVTRSGCSLLIANGKIPGIISDIFTKENIGTLFLPTENLSCRKRWIGYATNITGKIIVNDGAVKALTSKDASLLPIGVTDIIGEFKKGDVVSVTADSGVEFARGMVNYPSEDCRKIIGCKSDKLSEILGYKNYDAVITRDNIVILQV